MDKGKILGASLTDFCEAFDCLDHNLVIAKLNTYGFSLPAFGVVHDYLSIRKQRTKVNNSYNDWQKF